MGSGWGGDPMILDSVFPVFALIGLGVVLHRRNLTDRAFLRQGDRLVYYVFFPALLFWKIGGADRLLAEMGVAP